jgi:ATP-binding cassette subfamily B protein
MDIIFREYWRVIWHNKWYFLLVMLALTSATALDYITPIFYKAIADGFAQPFSDQTLAILRENFVWVFTFYVGIWCSWRVLEVGIIPLEAGGIALLEKRCFAVLKNQQYDFFENQFSGSLVKQANRFSRAFETIMDWFLFQFYANILAITISFIIFFQQQPEFAYYFLIWVVMFISWSIGFSVWKLKFDKAVSTADSVVGGAYSDAIMNMSVVKSFALEAAEQSQIDQAADVVYRKKKIAWILMFVSFAVQALMTFGIELFLLDLMIEKWQSGDFSVGQFVLFQSLLLLLIHRLWEFGRNFRNFFTALADASEMAEIIRADEVESDRPNARAQRIKQGDILFDDVSFAYGRKQKESKNLFEHFSLHIKAGEKIALVGQSGSGKTSLTKLLFRFFEPQSGQILFDGVPATEFTLSSLRQQISLVPQQPELFHRSLRENIILDKVITEQRLEQAAAQSQALEFIQALPEQFDTLVGERGVKLSGGERQRVAIARAFLDDAPIVVLDEATSALDSITEQQIQTAIFELIKDKTAIVIAHRLSTVLKMDRIIVMDKGRIIEQGNHQELLALEGKYFAMWQHQSGGFLLDTV